MALFVAINFWIASKSAVSVTVHLTSGATIGIVRVSLCGRPVSLSRVDRATYRSDAHWIVQCSWQELDVDLVSPSGRVLHHQLCHYDGLGEMDVVADVPLDKLALKCDYNFDGPASAQKRLTNRKPGPRAEQAQVRHEPSLRALQFCAATSLHTDYPRHGGGCL